MKYCLKIEGRAAKELKSLDISTQKRIIKKLKFYLRSDDPFLHAKKLSNKKDAEYRWRIGNYRVVFDVEKNIIKVMRVQHRKDVYK